MGNNAIDVPTGNASKEFNLLANERLNKFIATEFNKFIYLSPRNIRTLNRTLSRYFLCSNGKTSQASRIAAPDREKTKTGNERIFRR